MARRIRTLILSLAGWLFLYPVSPLPGEESGFIEVTFSVYALRPPSDLRYLEDFTEEDPASREVRFFSSHRSREYSYKGPPDLTFFTEEILPPDPEDPESESQILRTPQARIRLSENVDRFFLLFFPHSENGDKEDWAYQIFPVEEGEEVFPRQNFLLINAAGFELAGRIGTQRQTISEGVHGPFQAPRSTQVQLRALYDDRVYTPLTYDLSLERDERAIMILFPTRQGRPHVRPRIIYERNIPLPGEEEEKVE